MTSQLALRLSDVDTEIRAARTRLSILRDELLERRREAEEQLVRSFMAETPLADRDYRLAESRWRRMESQARSEEGLLGTLMAERERLRGLEGALKPGGDNPGPETFS